VTGRWETQSPLPLHSGRPGGAGRSISQQKFSTGQTLPVAALGSIAAVPGPRGGASLAGSSCLRNRRHRKERHEEFLALAIAIGVLAAAGKVPRPAAAGVMFFGELGLDGRLRPVRGVLPAVAAAVEAGFGKVMVAGQNAAEAVLVPGVRVIAASSLAMAADWLRGISGPDGGPAAAEFEGGQELPGRRALENPGEMARAPAPGATIPPDLAEMLGQSMARRAAEVCAQALMIRRTRINSRAGMWLFGHRESAPLRVDRIHGQDGWMTCGSLGARSQAPDWPARTQLLLADLV
jgi:hypothetical protein